MKVTIYTGKPFKTFNGRWDDLGSITIQTIDQIGYYYYEHSFYNRSGTIFSFDEPVKNLDKLIYSNTITTLDPDKVLYFDKSSKYPRFKIKDSGYKRCIKPEKADYIVIGDEISTDYNNDVVLLEDDNFYYIFYSTINDYRINSSDPRRIQYSRDPYAYLRKYPNIFPGGKMPKLIFTGTLYVATHASTIEKIVNGEYKSIITDRALDTVITGTIPHITEAEFESVKSLIESPDRESKGLGLRLLAGYDLSEVWTALKFLLLKNQYELTYTSEWQSTAVKLLRKQLGYLSSFNVYNIKNYMTLEPKSDLDKTLLRRMLIDAIKEKVGSDLRWLNEQLKDANPYDIKIDIKVE